MLDALVHEPAVADPAGVGRHRERAPEHRHVVGVAAEDHLDTIDDQRADPPAGLRHDGGDDVTRPQWRSITRASMPRCGPWCNGSRRRRSASAATRSVASAAGCACSSASPTTTTTRRRRALADKIWNLRVFDDDAGVMNRSAGRRRRRAAGRQPVHALRRHVGRAPSELDRRRPAGARRTARRRSRRRAAPPRRDRGDRPLPHRDAGRRSSTTVRSPSSSTADGDLVGVSATACRVARRSAAPQHSDGQEPGRDEHAEQGDDPRARRRA